jgi:hypothetical protein
MCLTALPIQRLDRNSAFDSHLNNLLHPGASPCMLEHYHQGIHSFRLCCAEDTLLSQLHFTLIICLPSSFGSRKMNTLKGYLISKQQKKNANKKVAVVPPVELTITPPGGSALPSPLPTSTSSPLSSRPSSIYPAGDFRNGDSGSILDIKTDVMVNWLHQQQMERLWSLEFPGEGVVLKKTRASFACSPASLRNDANGFYQNIVAMNVRVCLASILDFIVTDLVEIVRHDCPNTNDEDFPSQTKCQPCPSDRWTAAPSPPLSPVLAKMSKTSFWRFHTRSTDAYRLG